MSTKNTAKTEAKTEAQTEEQKTMHQEAPEAAEESKFFTKKRVLIGTAVVAGVGAAAFFAPKAVRAFKAKQAAKVAAKAIESSDAVAKVAEPVFEAAKSVI